MTYYDGTAFANHDADEQEGQVREITPKVMSLLKGRLEHVFLRLSSTSPNDPVLKNISQMTSITQRITDSMRTGGISGASY